MNENILGSNPFGRLPIPFLGRFTSKKSRKQRYFERVLLTSQQSSRRNGDSRTHM